MELVLTLKVGRTMLRWMMGTSMGPVKWGRAKLRVSVEGALALAQQVGTPEEILTLEKGRTRLMRLLKTRNEMAEWRLKGRLA